jgi:UDPglucose 6-dehydrogenase
VRDKVKSMVGGGKGAVVAVLGLTYKPGTDTLRRSLAVELCRWMHGQGVTVRAHDPAVRELPDDLRRLVDLRPTAHEALDGADVAVVATEWPQFRELKADDFAATMRRPRVIDQNWFLSAALGGDPRITYVATGSPGTQHGPE